MGRIARLLVALSILANSTALLSADFDAGRRAYELGDYQTALREWRPLAEQGHTVAHNDLGVRYAGGKGVPEDYVQAYKWWNLAAAQGHANASYNVRMLEELMTRSRVAEGQRLSRELRVVKPSSAVPTQRAQPQRLVLNVQRALAELGYDPGPIDGLPGGRRVRLF